ncbi:3-phosphoshikimate 1-carboxyvinyltransferase [Marinomonas mediterranea]|jgi:3-phosphoshikimate 1-carboxyvinyltransferase (EC 2.5.1.19)|uniref:3-phosphoshikimate 1-carboxyvinyltransferase n=1 Tax=Marinomonas mediterranea (strain ATCC 700492 / JCM 21426 / NBRC 103028 / MMB-1) TaxID=717774 RepID=F2K281_MARM1|nr:3-phosphoshikimate 1-carboxyvinyltransferase [Marinomonas mediterranea]ADZ91159.1 3-phosphoshikimate 1-carboxyvinyltransferase [Marinomonas mediterranea MMB-1]WCN17289.1 3-phosphoshikimate 1-carboxyvinyltransferase [Marinomonas mediterranea MMB-1]
MESLTLGPLSSANGEIQIPGSKSLSNRILLLATLAKGTTKITNLLDSDDIRHMLNALKTMGVQYTLEDDGRTCILEGLGGPINATQADLFLGNAGTAMRPLAAALCLGEGEFLLHGEPRMHERPIGDLIDALKSLGVDVEYQAESGYPPLKINAAGLNGGEVSIKGNISSQFLTALLMSAPLAKNDLVIRVDGELVSKPYIDITLHVMKQFGIEVENQDYQAFVVKGQQTYVSPGEIMVEGDASSASYFLAAAAIAGGKIKVHGVGSDSVQGDVKFADALAAMGAKITYGPTWIESERGELKGIDMDMNHIPDAAMTIATTALFAEGTTTIRNIYNWRVKETDRLNAMATELKKLGADVIEGDDYITVTPVPTLKHAAIDTYNDHRIAMCFSLVAFSDTKVTINDPGCTSKTFPTYFDLFSQVAK